jgi:lysophospholipase L1-like esterase
MRARRFGLWLALIAVAAVVLVAGLEILLQTGAWVVRLTGRDTPSAWLTDDVRVLCLGDSNTYGIYVEPDESWPAQLEKHWNESVASPKIRVFNLGYPGTNSSKVVSQTAKVLETFRPDVTIVMVGANDFWTKPVDVAPEPDPHNALVRFVERHSRLYKLAYMLAHAGDSDELVVPRVKSRGEGRELRKEATFGDETFDLGFTENSEGFARDQVLKRAKTTRSMSRNFEELVRRARDGGTKLVFMTYPAQEEAGFYAAASREVWRVARQTGTPLVNLRSVFAARCPEPDCRELLSRDQHPNARGYAIVAEDVAGRLRELLAEPRERR